MAAYNNVSLKATSTVIKSGKIFLVIQRALETVIITKGRGIYENGSKDNPKLPALRLCPPNDGNDSRGRDHDRDARHTDQRSID